jgi:hypothetical protein
MKRVYIQDHIYIITGWPGRSGLCFSFETEDYTIQLNTHDDPEKCLQRGLDEIQRRETAIVSACQMGGAAV